MSTMREGASVLVALTVLCGCAVAELPEWIQRERIRGAYFHNNLGRDHLEALKANGCNTLLTKFAQLSIDLPPEAVERVKLYAQWSEELGLHFLPIVNLLGGSPERKYLATTKRRETDAKGRVYAKTPCPLDRGFWQAAYEKRGKLMASLSQDCAIDGFVLDPEMYGADHTIFGGGGCFCDECFREFYQAQGLQAPDVPAAERAQALKAAKLERKYREWQIDTVAQMAAESRKAIHAINPRLVLGVLLLDYDVWCMDGWRRGLGTAASPVIAFSEITYGSGYTKYVDDQVKLYGEQGGRIVFCPGLWLNKFLAQEVPGHLYEMAAHSAGYWLYTTYSLARPPEKLSAGYALPETQEAYWAAIKRANEELDRRAAAGPGYRSRLKVENAPAMERVQAAGVHKPLVEKLKPVPGAEPEPRDLKAPATQVRGSARYLIQAEAGERIRIRMKSVKLGNYQDEGAYALLARARKVVKSGELSLQRATEVALEPKQAGLYELLVLGRSNPFYAAIDARHAVLEVPAKGLHLLAKCTRMYFWVPAGVSSFEMKVSGTGAGETAKLTVYRPTGEVAGEADTEGGPKAELRLTAAPEEQSAVWSLVVEKGKEGIFEDATLHVDPKIPPYLSDRPGALLVPEE